MPDSYDVAMFQAALQKKTHLLPRGSHSTTTKNEPKTKPAMASEVTLVEANPTSQPQKEESNGRRKSSSICVLVAMG